MIDHFALALTHGLLLLAAWRLMFNRALDDETEEAEVRSVGEQLRRQKTDGPTRSGPPQSQS